MSRPNVLLTLRKEYYDSMFSAVDRQRLLAIANLIVAEAPGLVDPAFLKAHLPAADVAITSWHTPALDEAILATAPRLRLVTHSAGSVKPVVSPALWRRGILVTSAAAAISCGVAEFCLGLILLGSKRAFWLGNATRAGLWKDATVPYGGIHEIYQQTIGVIGAGFVGRKLIALLRQFSCTILVYDPFLTAAAAREIGATKAETLDELFAGASVVTLNAPTTPDTIGMIRGTHFSRLRDGSLFINTARSILVNQEEMVTELRKERFVACIDVTEPEPPPPDHVLRHLPNVWLTPHVAGAVRENRLRMGTMVVDEIERFARGEPPVHGVTEAALAKMA